MFSACKGVHLLKYFRLFNPSWTHSKHSLNVWDDKIPLCPPSNSLVPFGWTRAFFSCLHFHEFCEVWKKSQNCWFSSSFFSLDGCSFSIFMAKSLAKKAFFLPSYAQKETRKNTATSFTIGSIFRKYFIRCFSSLSLQSYCIPPPVQWESAY